MCTPCVAASELRSLGNERCRGRQTGQGQVFPMKIPQPRVGVRDRRIEWKNRVAARPGQRRQRGQCGFGDRRHNAFLPPEGAQLARTAKQLMWGAEPVFKPFHGLISVKIPSPFAATCYLSDACLLLKATLRCRFPPTAGPLHALRHLPGCSSLTSFQVTFSARPTLPLV